VNSSSGNQLPDAQKVTDVSSASTIEFNSDFSEAYELIRDTNSACCSIAGCRNCLTGRSADAWRRRLGRSARDVVRGYLTSEQAEKEYGFAPPVE